MLCCHNGHAASRIACPCGGMRTRCSQGCIDPSHPPAHLEQPEPVDYYLTWGMLGSWLHHGKCDLTRGQEGGTFYTKTQAVIVLRNKDAHACPCIITNR